MSDSPGHVLLSLRMRQACRLQQQGQPVAKAADACGCQSSEAVRIGSVVLGGQAEVRELRWWTVR